MEFSFSLYELYKNNFSTEKRLSNDIVRIVDFGGILCDNINNPILIMLMAKSISIYGELPILIQ